MNFYTIGVYGSTEDDYFTKLTGTNKNLYQSGHGFFNWA